MKNWLAPFICCIFVTFTSCAGTSIKGNGEVITVDQEIISPFNKIDAACDVFVRIYNAPETRITLIIDSNLLEYVKLGISNDTLHIRTTGRINNSTTYIEFLGRRVTERPENFTAFIVDIYCPDIAGVSASRGNIEFVDKNITPSFTTKISGSGRITGPVETDKYSAHISGAGCITISGISKRSAITISDAGQFEGKEFKTNNCIVNIRNSGEASIWVTENLEAYISNSGILKYMGTPKTNFRGSGKILIE
jgi:hypothetical protein